jgi:hypothetical protein
MTARSWRRRTPSVRLPYGAFHPELGDLLDTLGVSQQSQRVGADQDAGDQKSQDRGHPQRPGDEQHRDRGGQQDGHIAQKTLMKHA